MWKLIALVLANMNMSEVCWRSHPRELSSFFFGIHIILMGILGVVDVLDEVELEVDLGTHLTKAFGASSNASISS